jgi:hypothetical protein
MKTRQRRRGHRMTGMLAALGIWIGATTLALAQDGGRLRTNSESSAQAGRSVPNLGKWLSNHILAYLAYARRRTAIPMPRSAAAV